jgi:hypothetical protein
MARKAAVCLGVEDREGGMTSLLTYNFPGSEGAGCQIDSSDASRSVIASYPPATFQRPATILSCSIKPTARCAALLCSGLFATLQLGRLLSGKRLLGFGDWSAWYKPLASLNRTNADSERAVDFLLITAEFNSPGAAVKAERWLRAAVWCKFTGSCILNCVDRQEE